MQPYVQMSESVRRVFSAYCAAASPDSREHSHAGKKRIVERLKECVVVTFRCGISLKIRAAAGNRLQSIRLRLQDASLAACKEKGAETNGTQGSAGERQVATCLTTANEEQVRKCRREIERHSLFGQRFKAQQTCFLPLLRGGAAHGRAARRCSASQRHAAADRWPTLREAPPKSRDRGPEP